MKIEIITIINIKNYANIKVLILIMAIKKISIIIFIKDISIIPPKSVIKVPIIGLKDVLLILLQDRDFLFQLKRQRHLSVYVYVVDHNTNIILIRNNINFTRILPKYAQLNLIIDYNDNDIYAADFNLGDLTIYPLI